MYKTAAPPNGGLLTQAGRALLLILPLLVILVGVIVWIAAVSRSGFWADDFMNVVLYYKKFGDITNDHLNTGKYIINAFWAFGTDAFGDSSDVPFLLLNTCVFASGLALWLRSSLGARASSLRVWWAAGLFIATASWLPTVLWASNITHSFGFLALGAAYWTHRRAMAAISGRAVIALSLVSGLFWTVAVVSDLLYIGLLPMAAYCVWQQTLRLHGFGVTRRRAAITTGTSSLALPTIYFVFVGDPATKSNPAYANTGLAFVHENLDYYKSVLAPTDLLLAIYAAIVLVVVVGGIMAMARTDLLPLVLLIAAGTTAIPALVQSEQRDIHYAAMPLLLLFSALALALPSVRRVGGVIRSGRLITTLGAIAALVLIYLQGAGVRSYFVQTPYGSNLTSFRSEVAALTSEGADLCVRLTMTPAQRAYFTASIAGEFGFLVPPISAGKAEFVTARDRCAANTVPVVVAATARNLFTATGALTSTSQRTTIAGKLSRRD